MPGDIIKARQLGKPLDRGYTAHWSYPFYSVKRADVKKKKIERSASQSIFDVEDDEPSGLCGCGDFWEAIRSMEFIGMVTYFSITIFNYNFFLGTASEQLILKGDNGDFLNAFAIIFPSGVIFLPLISCTLDRFKRFGLSIMLASVAATGVIYGAILLIPNLEVRAKRRGRGCVQTLSSVRRRSIFACGVCMVVSCQRNSPLSANTPASTTPPHTHRL